MVDYDREWRVCADNGTQTTARVEFHVSLVAYALIREWLWRTPGPVAARIELFLVGQVYVDPLQGLEYARNVRTLRIGLRRHVSVCCYTHRHAYGSLHPHECLQTIYS